MTYKGHPVVCLEVDNGMGLKVKLHRLKCKKKFGEDREFEEKLCS
jgi:hypothetical protein